MNQEAIKPVISDDPFWASSSHNMVPTGTSLNDIKTSGVYYVWGKYNNAHTTNNIYGFMMVYCTNASSNPNVVQVVFGATSSYVAYRGYTNSQWYSWKMIQAGEPIDIASSFAYKLSDGSYQISPVWFDPLRKTVTGFFYVFNASPFNSNTTIFEIAEPYRPSGNIGMPMMIKNSEGWSAHAGAFYANGTVKQSLTASATHVYCAFQYLVSGV